MAPKVESPKKKRVLVVGAGAAGELVMILKHCQCAVDLISRRHVLRTSSCRTPGQVRCDYHRRGRLLRRASIFRTDREGKTRGELVESRRAGWELYFPPYDDNVFAARPSRRPGEAAGKGCHNLLFPVDGPHRKYRCHLVKITSSGRMFSPPLFWHGIRKRSSAFVQCSPSFAGSKSSLPYYLSSIL